MNSRACAAKAVFDVLEKGRSLTDALANATEKLDNPKDKGLVAELAYGVLRWLPQLDWACQSFVQKPFKGRHRVIHHLMLVGVYQLKHTRIPPHAALSETVAATRQLNGKAFSGVINAVLRELQRNDAAETNWPSESVQYAHPGWYIKAIKEDYPTQWQAILDANNQRAPMWLRVNTRSCSVNQYMAHLQERSIAAATAPQGKDAILLEQPADVRTLPGYEEGWFSVQDLAAQQSASFLPLLSELNALDVCAAPGGKACHWQEKADNKLNLTALDIDENRLKRVQQNLQRLGLSAKIITGDASQRDWWDEKQYDAILLDAPCSATGVIRRHADIKWLRTKADIEALVSLQSKILKNVWSMLKPGGTLLYATCSVLNVENQRQISEFLQQQQDAELDPIHQNESVTHPGWQILPGEHQMDGFYYARLKKKGS